ncbi:argininosuccinate synthetase [Aspergillus fumigatus]|nr:argininosuccinate synthetase [Aspergillus fumigatus]
MSKGKVCLAFSGGLDTSVILKWLIDEGYEVVAFTANVGQEGTSLARPVIARAQIDVAKREGCFAVSHGCTGKGNDQVRFELAFYALQPDIKVIAPWRDPAFYNRFAGRNDLLSYAAEKGIPVTSTKAKPWSMDENLAHCSYEAGILEDPNVTPPADMWKLTQDPLTAPDQPEDFTVHFETGIPVKLEYTEGGQKKVATDAVDLFLTANTIARRNGVGRIDIVENRFIGIKSRGCYETPGLTCLRAAHIDLEGLVLDREVRALRDQFVTFNYSKLLYNGLYFSPEREFLEASITASQKTVNGQVRCRAYKGSISILGRSSETEKLYDMSESSMDEIGDFAPTETTGFIGVSAIRLKKYGQMKQANGEKM